jgi:hypothetical protein
MENLKELLIKDFGIGEPIIIKQIDTKNKYGLTPAAFQKRLERMAEKDELVRFEKGIYYVPQFSKLLKRTVPLRVDKVVKKKYIEENDDIVGFTTGLGLLNDLGLTTQVPRVTSIVTERTSKTTRVIEGGFQQVELIKPKYSITKLNYKYLQLFEIMAKYWDMIEYPDETALKYLETYLQDIKGKISRGELIDMLMLFPAKVSARLLDKNFESLLPER